MSIHVVGAGPGDSKLLTVRAVELLAEADVVAHGDLVPVEIAKLYAPKAKVVKIGHKRQQHDAVVEMLINEAKAGRKVVILKNGDPTVFGRGHQICRKAQEAGVPCEVVPGVTAFAAAAALHAIDLTDGVALRHLALLSYPHVDLETVRSISADTLVIYMMGDRLGEVGEILEAACGETEVYLCHAVTQGGSCIKTTPRGLRDYRLKPALVIARCKKGG